VWRIYSNLDPHGIFNYKIYLGNAHVSSRSKRNACRNKVECFKKVKTTNDLIYILGNTIRELDTHEPLDKPKVGSGAYRYI
jgi:hypothetical protein